MISAKILCDSINKDGNRLTTFLLEYPKYIHSELMTHRIFSRNSSSSRAIPVERLISMVEDNPVTPIFMYNKKGMAAEEYLEGDNLKAANNRWVLARENAIRSARSLSNLGVHKQIVNRLLEPFGHIAVVLSSTEFKNFFDLRINPGAQQEIQELATKMKKELDTYSPRKVNISQWHLPFITRDEEDLNEENKIRVSIARCARVSYYNFEGKVDYKEDIALFHKLKSSKHWSPFEHVAKPSLGKSQEANFRGWTQARFYEEMDR